MLSTEQIEWAAPEDAYLNYCLWPYQPVASCEGKWRSVNLLLQSFQLAGIDPRAYDVMQAIRQEIGDFGTVWGVKQVEDSFGWEYYFYDYGRRERNVSITRVLNAIQPYIKSDVRALESLPYFMFSLDIDESLVTGQRLLPEVHMYVGNPGSTVSSGIAYAVRPHETVLENFYFFFDADRQLQDVAAKICCSPHTDANRIDVNQILRSELRRCQTICIANKQRNDTAYFSGVNVDQLLFFLNWLEYPAALIEYTQQNRDKFDHLLFDVGFDFTAIDGCLKIVKSGFYGVF